MHVLHRHKCRPNVRTHKKKKKNGSDSFFSDTISEFLDIRAYKTQRLVALVPEN